jgi:hypothetical protein
MPVAWETYSTFAKSQMRRIGDRVIPRGRQDLALRVDVLSGLHAGSSMDLSGGSFAVGPDPAHDVMLIDDAMIGAETWFSCEMSVFGPLVSITTGRGDVIVNGVSLQAHVRSAPQRLPCNITINGIGLRLNDTTAGLMSARQRFEKTVPILLVVLAVGAFATQMLRDTPSHTLIGMPDKTTDASMAAPDQASSVLAENNIKAMIVTAGLEDYLHVTATAPHSISITGDLPARLMPEWHRIRLEIDEITTAEVVVSHIAALPQLADLPPIAAVRLGSPQSVIFANGDTAAIGDQLTGNWTIKTIEAESIALQRDDEKIVVSF